VKTVRRTGPSEKTRRMVLDRSGGWCEVCGDPLHNGDRWIAAHSIHHRQPRGMGGTSDPAANAVMNLMLVCGTGTTGCHGRIESHRTVSIDNGWLVPRPTDPATAPVVISLPAGIRLTGVPAYFTAHLTPDGAYQEINP
jgi:hypothetical protein